MENIISAQHLVYTYPGESFAAVNDVSINVKQGELVAVLGHNGSGKSTFAKNVCFFINNFGVAESGIGINS